MSKHADIDARIIKLIDFGAVHFGQLCIHMRDVEFRLIDRRLQALKKKGQIKFMGQSWGWRVTP